MSRYNTAVGSGVVTTVSPAPSRWTRPGSSSAGSGASARPGGSRNVTLLSARIRPPSAPGVATSRTRPPASMATRPAVADPGPPVGVGARRVRAEHADGARRRLAESGQDLHGRRLPGAVGTEQREDLAVRYLQVHPVEHSMVPVLLVKVGDRHCD